MDKLLKLFNEIGDKDILIIGKGRSMDEIRIPSKNDFFVINTNDSERILLGNISVVVNQEAKNYIDNSGECDLYITSINLSENLNQVKLNIVNHSPDGNDLIFDRFFSNDIILDKSTIIAALKIANEIGRRSSKRNKVYLTGFDFESYNIGKNVTGDYEYDQRILTNQESELKLILNRANDLDIEIFHVGNKDYSRYSVAAFNKLLQIPYLNYEEIIKTNITEDYKVQIVAEITTNHFGDRNRLKTMIMAAKEAGANFVKLQKRDVESFYTQDQLNSPYSSPFGKTFRDYRNGLELSYEDFLWVDEFCNKIKIGWFASILDEDSFDFILKFNPKLIKLPSTISEHKKFIEKVGSNYANEVVISTGFTGKEYEYFIQNTFKSASKLYLLQCTSAYPARKEEVQLGVVRSYYNLSRENPKIVPGFSSHDIGSVCSMMAVAAGAKMIEKHVKLGNVNWSHFDEVAIDLATDEFVNFVKDVRLAEKIVGDETKKIQSGENHKYWIQKCN